MSNRGDGASVQQRKEISLSIEETNRLRISLGLRPLRVSSPSHNRQCREEKVEQPKAGIPSIQERIEKSRRARQAKILRTSVAPASIVDHTDSENESEDDIAAWVAKTRKTKNKPVAQRTNVAVSRELMLLEALKKDKGRDLTNLKFDHDEGELEDQEATILTLKDTNVLDEDGTKTLATEDVLESIDILQRTKQLRPRNKTPVAGYDATDASEFAEVASQTSKPESDTIPFKKQGLVIGKDKVMNGNAENESDVKRNEQKTANQLSLSVAVDDKPKFEEDYEVGDWQVRALSRKRKTRYKSKKRRRREASDDTEHVLRNMQGDSSSAPAEDRRLLRVAEIRIKAAQKMNHDDDEDEDEHSALHNSLRRAREKARKAGVDASVQRILNIIDRADEDTNGNGEFDDSAADMIFNEMEQFVQNIPVDEAEAEGSNSDMDISNQQGERHHSDAKGKDIVAPLDTHQIASSVPSTVDSSAILFDADSNPTADTGVAAALSRFRGMGDLHRPREQRGRAKDERIDWKEVDENVKVAPGQRSIKLLYTDENGHELTPKEAFRLLCHKFHGKGPSKNKREIRLRRELQKMRLQQMPNDDTPLGSTSALRRETKRTGLAHVVLSGSSAAIVQSSLDERSLAKGRQ